MYILGISADHNASAALLKDGKVIVCVSEERFNRIKKINEVVKAGKEKIIFVDHHLCHALTALYGAPYLKQGIEEILVLTADGEGDRFAATVSIYKKGELT